MAQEGRSWQEDLENERRVDKMMLDFAQADEKLSNMSHDEIVKSWLYYRNSYVRLTN